MLLIGVVLAALTSASAAPPQEVPASRVKHSIWKSTYKAPNGQNVQATITFNGKQGTYRTSFGTGHLYDIEYFFDTAGNNDYPWVGKIVGKWSLHGASGTFRFYPSSETLEFTGDWDFGNGTGNGGPWNGRFERLIDNTN